MPRLRAGLLALGCALAAAPAGAADLKIFPVRLALTSDEPVATMTLQNAGQEAALLQMRVYAWSQRDGQDVLEPTREVLANPGVFDLAPGAEQIARFGLQATPSAVERSYRVVIEEVPRAPPGRPGEIRTLLRVSVPVFVESATTPARLRWTVRPAADGSVGVEVSNEGGAHAQLTRIRLERPGGGALAEESLSAYVLPGASRRLELKGPASLRPGEALTVRAATDGGEVQATVTAQAGADEPARR